jgi:HNH endonuclease
MAKPATNLRERRYVDPYYGYVWIKPPGELKFVQEHVWKWKTLRGPVPKGWVIHHKDEDKTNNKIGNLQCVSRAEHARLHSKGRVLSEEVKEKMRKAALKVAEKPGESERRSKRAAQQHAQGKLGRSTWSKEVEEGVNAKLRSKAAERGAQIKEMWRDSKFRSKIAAARWTPEKRAAQAARIRSFNQKRLVK